MNLEQYKVTDTRFRIGLLSVVPGAVHWLGGESRLQARVSVEIRGYSRQNTDHPSWSRSSQPPKYFRKMSLMTTTDRRAESRQPGSGIATISQNAMYGE